MIDDATSELTARFVRHDSTEENMRLLWAYLERHGRPVAFYTDKASLFRMAPKVARDGKELPREERAPLPPTQIGRALQELGIVWHAAHSPQSNMIRKGQLRWITEDDIVRQVTFVAGLFGVTPLLNGERKASHCARSFSGLQHCRIDNGRSGV